MSGGTVGIAEQRVSERPSQSAIFTYYPNLPSSCDGGRDSSQSGAGRTTQSTVAGLSSASLIAHDGLDPASRRRLISLENSRFKGQLEVFLQCLHLEHYQNAILRWSATQGAGFIQELVDEGDQLATDLNFAPLERKRLLGERGKQAVLVADKEDEGSHNQQQPLLPAHKSMNGNNGIIRMSTVRAVQLEPAKSKVERPSLIASIHECCPPTAMQFVPETADNDERASLVVSEEGASEEEEEEEEDVLDHVENVENIDDMSIALGVKPRDSGVELLGDSSDNTFCAGPGGTFSERYGVKRDSAAPTLGGRETVNRPSLSIFGIAETADGTPADGTSEVTPQKAVLFRGRETPQARSTEVSLSRSHMRRVTDPELPCCPRHTGKSNNSYITTPPASNGAASNGAASNGGA